MYALEQVSLRWPVEVVDGESGGHQIERSQWQLVFKASASQLDGSLDEHCAGAGQHVGRRVEPDE